MSYYNDILTLVNQLRAEAGVQPLTLDTTLCQAATMRAIEIDYSDYFSHSRPDGTSCFTVFNTYYYKGLNLQMFNPYYFLQFPLFYYTLQITKQPLLLLQSVP